LFPLNLGKHFWEQISPMNHAAIIPVVQLVETEIGSRVKRPITLADEKSAVLRIWLYHQCDLVWKWEKVAV